MKRPIAAFALVLAASPAFAQQADRVPPPAHDTSAIDAATRPARAPSAITLNLGTVAFSGNMQVWFKAGSSDVVNTFLLRRAQMKFVGSVSPLVRWTLMLDAAKSVRGAGGTGSQTGSILQDAFITLKTKRLDIQAGQFILPLSFEGGGFSSVRHEAVERSLFITAGKLAQVRELGAQVSGFITAPVRFRLGVFNSMGEIASGPAVEGQKAIVGRLETQTPITGLTLGGSGAYTGRDSVGRARHDRLGADVEYARRRLGLRGEVMRGHEPMEVRTGAYGLASYRVADQLQIVGRYDYWDRDGTAAPQGIDVVERDLLGGVSWFIDGSNVQLRANYILRRFDALPQKNQVIVSLQTAW
jgi:hypothetical protein